jgi:hypothetical protein
VAAPSGAAILENMGRLTGERRALSAAVLGFYGFIYLLMALSAPEGWTAALSAMAAVYGLGFFSLVAGYFWARWYSVGLGMSGLITAVFSMFQIGMEPVLVFYGVTHGFVSLVLWGNGMAASFDGRKEWRERFHLDESATHRLGKSIIRLGISLPYVILYALAPKDGAGEMLLAVVAGTLAASGLYGIVKLRGWGILALAGGAAALVASLAQLDCGASVVGFGNGYAMNVGLAGAAALILMLAAIAPFARPVTRYLLRG